MLAAIGAWFSSKILSIAQGCGDSGVEEIKKQLMYMWFLTTYQEKLDEQKNALELDKQEVDRILELEEKNTNGPTDRVKLWIDKTKKTMDEARLLNDAINNEDKRCFCDYCPDLFWRRGKSIEAEKLTKTLEGLIAERKKLGQNLTQAPTEIPNARIIENKDFFHSEASEAALHDIMAALDHEGVNMIGLHGMPGVGKTTLANYIMETLSIRAKDETRKKEDAEKEKLFDDFVIVTVTENFDISGIQNEMAKQLGVTFDQEKTTTEKAGKLKLRLQDKKKKLLVLDDVCGELKLNEIGIPMNENSSNCKILIITRREYYCGLMKCQRTILLNILTEVEAWILFKKTADIKDGSPLTDVGKKIAEECGCLPIAVVSVGKALRWKPAVALKEVLKQLQKGDYQKIRDLNSEENAYKCLKLSFEELQEDEIKKFLLLCSLFPKYQEICVEDLTKYALGLGLCEDASSMEDAMDKVQVVLYELQDFHLLSKARRDGYVKMHDLVRDVVLLIGKSSSTIIEPKPGKEFFVRSRTGSEEWPTGGIFRDCTVISLFDNKIKQLPDQLDAPRLEMLLLERKTLSPYYIVRPKLTYVDPQGYTDIPDKSFEGVEKLQVLSVTYGTLSLQSLQSLTNLRTLELRHCKFTSGANLAFLSNLKGLEILSFYGSNISEVPDEMGELKNLKVLDLTNSNLQRISSTAIRKLSKLEELLIGKFDNWDKGTGNANLMDIHSSSLQHLGILSLRHSKVISRGFAFSNLIGYDIHICDCLWFQFPLRFRHPSVRNLCITATEDIVFASKHLFGNVKDLRLECSSKSFRNMIPDMSDTGFEQLSRLYVQTCEMECLVSYSKHKNVAQSAFSNLEDIYISNVSLIEICKGQPLEGFLKKLRTITIQLCNHMVIAFPTKLLQAMKKLENVTVERCKIMQAVFDLDGLHEANNDCLSHLSELGLYSLDDLTCIWKGPTNLVNLTSLTTFVIRDCKSLTYIFSVSVARSLVHLEKLEVYSCENIQYIISEADGEEALSKNHPMQIHLKNLKSVEISECHELKYVFPVTVVRGLPNLTELDIRVCNQLVAVFGNEDKTDTAFDQEAIVFHKLTDLNLALLPKLVILCPRGFHFKFSSLQNFMADGCMQLKTSFNATPDTSVYAKHVEVEEQATNQDTEIKIATNQVLFTPRAPDIRGWWTCSEGEWIFHKSFA